jgi:molybdenum cofactor biosynthesis enzyme MoaA
MKTLKEALEICTQFGVDPGKIKISGGECPRLEKQIWEAVIKQLRDKKKT